MDQFSISELSRFSGVNAFVIRTWEKRYNALQPLRTVGNTRYYNGEQLRRLLNITALLDYDYKISEVASMTDEELFSLIEKNRFIPSNNQEEYFIKQLIGAALTYDEMEFGNIFAHCCLRYGLSGAWKSILYPLLERIGLFWTCNKIGAGNEHFLVNLLNRKLQVAIDLLPAAKPEAGNWLLFLPENEFHETGLLLAQFLIRDSKQNTIYLGASTPLSVVQAATKKTRPDYMLLFLVHHDDSSSVQHYLDELSSNFKGRKIYVACKPSLSKINVGKKLQFLASVTDLEKILHPV